MTLEIFEAPLFLRCFPFSLQLTSATDSVAIACSSLLTFGSP
jgi:hypothetical protein